MPNSRKIIFGQVPAHSHTNFSCPTSKFKIPLLRLFSPCPEVSKNVCDIPVGQKLWEAIYFLETGCFWQRLYPWDRLFWHPTQKLLVWCWTGPENFIKILSFHQKLFIFFKDWQMDTKTDTDTCPPIHIGVGNFFNAFFILITSQHSLWSLRWWRMYLS